MFGHDTNTTTIILPDILPVNKTKELYYLIPAVIVLLFLIVIIIYTWNRHILKII